MYCKCPNTKVFEQAISNNKDTKKAENIHTDTIYEFIITHIARTHPHIIDDSNLVL